MRLFVSYARVYKPYCIQIVDTLEVHEVWFDQRLYAGQQWWKEILRRLDWCEGFVYLLSPDSVGSEYCRREFDLALNLGRPIFPVLIHEKTPIPDALREVQYADLSKGLTPEAVRVLLSSIQIAERQKASHNAAYPTAITADEIKLPTINSANVISEAAAAMEKGQFDQAVFLLKQAKGSGFKPKFINIDALLEEAEMALNRQTYLREAEREYKQIVHLVKLKRTRKLGCEAFGAFRRDFPDYDPDQLAQLCAELSASTSSVNGAKLDTPPAPPKNDFTLNLLEWCDIPAGMLLLDEADGKTKKQMFIDGFKMSRYPITNAQYQAFLDDPMGYANLSWWQYSTHAHEWRMANPQPQPSRYQGDERPREMVNWYDALAFCHWLSARLGVKVTLPTQRQWQRAARGDDARQYPWGSSFDKSYANTRESELKMTTFVTRYANAVSPYQVWDMAGNVCEWCLDSKGGSTELTNEDERIVMGGSFVSDCSRAAISFHYLLNPKTLFGSIGFRVVREA
ncbi:MAG: SUMF1/EgtB/PvdO family nonheme iron enzyme [Chloroflexi bacterium]|nr:SUMF1/EgtB/PvdO family nonheme iron enzyme [Chloroflexota bacterium]